jgi:hypothetical protein
MTHALDERETSGRLIAFEAAVRRRRLQSMFRAIVTFCTRAGVRTLHWKDQAIPPFDKEKREHGREGTYRCEVGYLF